MLERIMPIKALHNPELEMLFGKGGNYPAVLCDFCAEPITDIRDGVYLLHEAADATPASSKDILFAHRDRADEEGVPIPRCHAQLEERLRSAGAASVGWIELAYFPAWLAFNMAGGAETLSRALELRPRDVWLLRWLAAGTPDAPLEGQPKNWNFRRSDLLNLANRLDSVLPRTDSQEAQYDDFQSFSTRKGPERAGAQTTTAYARCPAAPEGFELRFRRGVV
jgi:hypothetical protein